MVLGLLFPTSSYDGASHGLNLFLTVLIPYLLPFLTLSKLLVGQLMRSGKVPNPFLLYLLAAIGGFPNGAALMKQTIHRTSIKHPSILFAAMQFPSPVFVIGFIGLAVFQDIGTGILIYCLIHLINGSIFCLWFFLPTQQAVSSVTHAKKTPIPFFLSLSETLTTIAVSVIVSCSLAEIFVSLFSIDEPYHILWYGALEFSSGIGLLTGVPDAIVWCGLLLGFSGMSVHLQNLLILRGERISFLPYWFSRLYTMIVLPFLLTLFH